MREVTQTQWKAVVKESVLHDVECVHVFPDVIKLLSGRIRLNSQRLGSFNGQQFLPLVD